MSALKNFGAFLMAAAFIAAIPPTPRADAATGDVRARMHHLFMEGRDALQSWDYGEAEKKMMELFELAAEDGSDHEVMSRAYVFKGHYCFFTGDYDCAFEALSSADDVAGLDDSGKELLDRVEKLSQEWENAEYQSSEHFKVRYMPGKDEVLIKPALETLEKAHAVLTKDFKIESGDPVLVEIYPDIEMFSAATGLDMEALENSGTIAICKYRRLMINSPRSLLRGYTYRDTLSHEFVHFLVYKKYGRAVPIWLHEGLAKYEDERWRGSKGGELSPSQESLLASALKLDELITFDRMHPSFAYLKTPRQGQLAFAEVTTVVRYLVETGGWDRVFQLCDTLAEGKDYREALREVTGKSFDVFWRDWIKYARGLDYKELPGMEITVLEIRKGDENFDQVDEEVGEEELSEGEHWRYVRLGDLLRDRGHYKAAVIEYEKARMEAPYSPRLLNKLGLCHFMAGNYEKAIEPLELGARIYPHHSTTLINLGRTYFKMERWDDAVRALNEALDINPFNPIPYTYLMNIHHERQETEKVRELKKSYELITG